LSLCSSSPFVQAEAIRQSEKKRIQRAKQRKAEEAQTILEPEAEAESVDEQEDGEEDGCDYQEENEDEDGFTKKLKIKKVFNDGCTSWPTQRLTNG
jgi:hypothetical protein